MPGDKQSFGKFEADIHYSSRSVVIDRIIECVPSFIRSSKKEKTSVEDGLTQLLCLELMANDSFPFLFMPQNMQDTSRGNSPKTDIGVYAKSGRKIFMEFEAKRLDSKLPKKRRKEYVIGEYQSRIQIENSGGIERFKNETHGIKVEHGGMIGYVQDNDFSFWLKSVNESIEAEIQQSSDPSLQWAEEDMLLISSQAIKHWSFHSISARISLGPIKLTHIWINLSDP